MTSINFIPNISMHDIVSQFRKAAAFIKEKYGRTFAVMTVACLAGQVAIEATHRLTANLEPGPRVVVVGLTGGLTMAGIALAALFVP